MKKITLALILSLASIPAYAQQWDQVNGSMQVKSGPSAPLVIIDQTASGQKILSLRANGTEVCSATATVFTCTGGFTIGGVILAADGTAAAPSYSFASETDFGFYRAGTRSLQLVGATGTHLLSMGANFSMKNDGVLGWSSTGHSNGSADVSLSRGAANRLDLATGDSFYIVSGGLGVGVTPPAAGSIEASGAITSNASVVANAANGLYLSPYAFWRASASSKVRLVNENDNGGIGLDVSTDNVVLFKNRAHNAAGGIGFASLAVSGTAPTVTSAGTSPSITASNGTAAFRVNVGTGGTATTIVLAMPAATTGWNCSGENITAQAANRAAVRTVFQASTTTSATLQNQNVATGAATAFNASDIVAITCVAF